MEFTGMQRMELLMLIPRLLKPWCKIKVEAELHFIVMVASLWQPCPVSCDTKTGRSSKGWIPISLLSTGILFWYLIWFEYVWHFLFSSAKKSQSKTYFIYRSFLFLEKTKPQSLNAVSMWLQIMVEVFWENARKVVSGGETSAFFLWNFNWK